MEVGPESAWLVDQFLGSCGHGTGVTVTNCRVNATGTSSSTAPFLDPQNIYNHSTFCDVQ